MDATEKVFALALTQARFLCPREKLLLTEMMGGVQGVFSLSRQDLRTALGRDVRLQTWQPGRLLDQAAGMRKRLTAAGIGCIFYGDSAYPSELREIYDPPLVLFFRGMPPESTGASVGVVGTRMPTGRARAAAYALGFGLAEAGLAVVSGLARGIDKEAHDGSVAAGGRSIAVLGCGIERIYPASSGACAARILKTGGTLLSEYPPGTPPLKPNFPARNRIVSGLCRAVVVVQAPKGSGALITAEHALEQGRELLVHRDGLDGSTGAGTRALAECGASVVAGSADVLREFAAVMEPGARPGARGPTAAARLKQEIARLRAQDTRGVGLWER
jgi:DNA processing protein